MVAAKPTVSITGYGFVSPGTRPLFETIYSNDTLIQDGRGQILKENLFQDIASEYRSLPYRNTIENLAEQFPISKPRLMTLFSIARAMKNAGWKELEETDGIVFATTTGHIPIWEADLMEYLKGSLPEEKLLETFQFQPLGLSLDLITDSISFRGPSAVISSACAAGTQAIQIAASWIRTGKVRRCLVGGTELLSELTLKGFNSFQLLSKEPARPFDRDRVGINLSEASAFLCLEAGTFERSLAIYSGGGMRSDAYHMTAPEPAGRGIELAMRSAIAEANLKLEDIGWIHAHGTGSKANDLAEAKSIHSLFGDLRPLVSSTKGCHGHALGASGVLESIICIEALKEQNVPGTVGFKTSDPEINLNLSAQPMKKSIHHILKSTLGFGGSNAAIVLSHPQWKEFK